MKKIVAYCRSACEVQGDESSVKRQARLIRRYARSRNLKICKMYMDPAYSGVSLNRPALTELLADCKTGNIKTVIVRDLDRLSRDLVQLNQLLAKFSESGVRIEFSTEYGRVNFRLGKIIWGLSEPTTV